MLKRFAAVLAVFLCLLQAGCAKREYVITTAFSGDEIMRINSKSSFMPEMMLYLTNMQNEYENVYGQELWDQNVPETPLDVRLKEMVLAKLAQVKVMNLMAEEYGLTLSDEDRALAESAAKTYFESLNDKEKELMGITEEVVVNAYSEICLAGRLYEYVIKDVNPEISDDESRIVTVWHIKVKDRETAKEALNLIESGEESFEAVAAKYSEDSEFSYTFGRGEMPPVIEEAAFSLDKDAVSGIIETETGFHILKCVSDFDVEMTQLNKETILKNERKRVFDETYESFLPGLTKILNRKLVDSIELIHDPEVTTASFFDAEF
ncbi:MAG: peptidylprolyl isomerase [Lachnospiraceae bacterium]|nr:peptidylprolyl isomerase [Lachnospiraceae bacterium]